MNDSPLLSKMDALLQKHRGGGPVDPAPATAPATASGPPPDAWLPILTDLIERGSPPSASASSEAPSQPRAPSA